MRDPRLDPRPGDKVVSADGEETALVLKVQTKGDFDEILGPLPHVHSLIDTRSGNRMRVVQSLIRWKTWAGAVP